jgi:hypothetical protein
LTDQPDWLANVGVYGSDFFRIPRNTGFYAEVTLLPRNSANHLALVGTATYAIDFVRAREKLVRSMRGGIELVHGIPILLSGTEDSALMRSWVNIEHWLGHVSTGSDILGARRTFTNSIMGRDISASSGGSGTGSQDASVPGPSTGSSKTSVHHPMRILLPVSLSGNATTIYHSTGYKLPKNFLPCSI